MGRGSDCPPRAVSIASIPASTNVFDAVCYMMELVDCFTALKGFLSISLSCRFLDGNNLTGTVPPSLLKKPGLKVTFTGNPVLCSDNPALCISPVAASSTAVSPATSSKFTVVGIIIGCVAGVLALVGFSISIVLFLLWRKQKRKRREYWKSGCDPDMDSKAQTMAYSFDEVKAATHNFKDFLGEGSFGPIYRGVLSDGREVAVKRCPPSHKLEALEFFDEVRVNR